MSHCYSVGVEINGKNKDVCTIVPGNEDLINHVKDSEANGVKPRSPTKDEINRSIDYYLKHSDKDHPKLDVDIGTDKKELNDMLED